MTERHCSASRQRSRRLGAILALVAASVLLAGCEAPDQPAPQGEVVRPVPLHTVSAEAVADKLRFPGRIRAARRAELAFNVPGFLAQFALNEGQNVKAGQIVARLDDSVFKARVAAARAEFERASADLGRYQRLWENELAVARSEVDDRVSRLAVARTNLAAAEQDLADTVLRAPFDGVITRRRMETFASVQARQPIADYQDLRALEVVIHVPERVFRSSTPRRDAVAVFEGQDDRPVALALKSFTSEADPQTQTFEIVLSLTGVPAGMTVLPGMSATVMPFDPEGATRTGALSIPLAAVSSLGTGQPSVWVVAEDGSVSARSLSLGEIQGDRVVVLDGLAAGERIATAGLQALRPGMKVRALGGDDGR